MPVTRRRILAAVVGLGGWLSGCGEEADGDGTPPTADGPDATGTPEHPAPSGGDRDPEFADEFAVTPADDYVAWGVGRSAAFTLAYEATNRRAERYDFDVLLYTAAAFEEYRAVVAGDATVPPPTLDGSATAVTSEVRRSVDLAAGTYYLVVDTTGVGSGGEAATEPRRVRVEATVRTR